MSRGGGRGSWTVRIVDEGAVPAAFVLGASGGAPLATPDARLDRLLYPIHDVETYLLSRGARDVLPPAGSRPPRTGT